MNRLLKLNAMADARTVFLACCASSRWAETMNAARPFETWQAVYQKAGDVWWHQLTESDWLEAFGGHPKIGGLDGLRKKFGTSATWSAQEQGGVADADGTVLRELAFWNERFEQKFGFIFIVCATGLSATDMLQRLKDRFGYNRAEALRQAAAEQAKITKLRLEKWQ